MQNKLPVGLVVVIIFHLLPGGSSFEEHICGSKDVRNNVDSFRDLENCTVIEGFLRILLISYAKPAEYENLHFPKLREITGHLLLYRVFGLRSLRNIFPNLAVIRGQMLFHDYALVVYEMNDMEDLGLVSLTTISRGAIRLEKNPKLCYINTIDWKRIAPHASREENYLLEKRRFRDNNCIDQCPAHCPTKKGPYGEEIGLCWTVDDCQKDCPSSCSSGVCNRDLGINCCHESCIGSCTGPDRTDCIACRHFQTQGLCSDKCGKGLYGYKNRRCINSNECKQFKKPDGSGWVLHDGQCIEDCPAGYMVDLHDRHSCRKCKDRCPKICPDLTIESLSDAENFRGCTVINGDLTVNVRGGKNVVKGLEEALSMIEEVDGVVEIRHSHAVLSLGFLSSLKRIKGRTLRNNPSKGKYALTVMDNSNLEDIWDLSTHPNLTIDYGKITFYSNGRLCRDLILAFNSTITYLNASFNKDDNDVYNNGDKAACDKQKLDMTIGEINHFAAIVRWSKAKMSDHRWLLSYIIHWKEAPYKNVTMYGGRDSCDTGERSWQSSEIKPTDGPGQFEMHYIYPLNAWTQYAVYVETFTVSSSAEGAVSDIIYFGTSPTNPTIPNNVIATALSPNELEVTWEPPTNPNGNVTHYYVYWQPLLHKASDYDRRNYCLKPLERQKSEGKKANNTDASNPKNPFFNGTAKCDCRASEAESEKQLREKHFQIEFENFLQNAAYHKRTVETDKKEKEAAARYKRDINEMTSKVQEMLKREKEKMKSPIRTKRETEGRFVRHGGRHRHSVDKQPEFSKETTPRTNYSVLPTPMENATTTEMPDAESTEPVYHGAIVETGKLSFIIPNLKHFTLYNIEVIACQDAVEENVQKLCSNRAMNAARTLPAREHDLLNGSRVTIVQNNTNDVYIFWPDIDNPNGLVLTYEIEMSRPGTDFQVQTICKTHKEYRQINGTVLRNYDVGEYSFRIRATTLAGTFNDTWSEHLSFSIKEKARPEDFWGPQNTILVSLFSALFLILVVVAVSVYVVRRRIKANRLPDNILYASVNPEYLSAGDVYVPDEWEVDRDKISLIRELGQGSFGMVYEGVAKDISEDQKGAVKVAVKTVNESASLRDRIEFLNEASVMKAFKCHHVVKLLGVVSKGQPTLVVMELMAQGDLKHFLRMHRPDEPDNNGRQPPTFDETLKMAGEIADGMAYLAAKKYVHRDLAARNCMVAEDSTVKIGDFGMTRDIYETDYYRKGGKGLLPVRWMAPESLKDGLFTSKADVWSFGVVLWEMATLAAQPYQGLANEQVLKFVVDGNTMEKPEGCPQKLYDLMLSCWKYYPKQRPSFCGIIEQLAHYMPPTFKQNSFYYSDENTGDKYDEAEHSGSMDEEAVDGDSDKMRLEIELTPKNKRRRQTPVDYSPNPDPMSQYALNDTEMTDLNYTDEEPPREDRSDSESKSGKSVSCECIKQTLQNEIKKRRRSSGTNSNNFNYPSAISSNEGSKGSSKSSSSGDGYSHMNGMLNGHVSVHVPASTGC